MANPVSIVQAIIELALKIKKEVEMFRHNREDCRKIGELVATVRAVAEGLRKTTEKEDGGALVGGALSALKQALERAWDLVVAYQRKNAVLRALDADAMALKLRRVYLDVSLNLSAVVLANGAYNTSKLADINGIVAALRADVTYNTWMLAKIMEIVAALPDAHLHLRQQVARLVQSYSDSTDEDASYYQNASTRETEKIEIEKTDDISRYSTYCSTYANPSSYGGYQRGQRQYVVPSDMGYLRYDQRYNVAASLGGGTTAQEFITNVQPRVVPSSTTNVVSGSHETAAPRSYDDDNYPPPATTICYEFTYDFKAHDLSVLPRYYDYKNPPDLRWLPGSPTPTTPTKQTLHICGG